MSSNDHYNPYEAVKRSSQNYHQRQASNPKTQILIDDSPIIPDFQIQDTIKKADYNAKIVVVGDGGCGKTCLLVSYAQNKFPEIYVPTIFENYVTNVATPKNKIIELALWDTAGQEEYDRLRPLSYPDVDVLLICFGLDNLTSLLNIKETWFPEVSHFCPGVPIVLVGTKSDLHSDIDPDLPIKFAQDINAVGYLKCSAKLMFNVKNVFNFALDNFMKNKIAKQQLENKSKNRLSKVFHSKKSSYDLSAKPVFQNPLEEDNYKPDYYKNSEYAFPETQKKKSKRCTIL